MGRKTKVKSEGIGSCYKQIRDALVLDPTSSPFPSHLLSSHGENTPLVKTMCRVQSLLYLYLCSVSLQPCVWFSLLSSTQLSFRLSPPSPGPYGGAQRLAGGSWRAADVIQHFPSVQLYSLSESFFWLRVVCNFQSVLRISFYTLFSYRRALCNSPYVTNKG